FSTMAARAAVRDAGRVLEIPYGVVDKVAKLIPEGPGQTLDACLKQGQELKVAYDADPVAREIVDLARPLEGLVRADSIHAAGVVIGDQPLTEYVPLQQKGPDQEVVTQFAMGDVEALGLLKIDFLGLRNLDVLDKAKALVDKRLKAITGTTFGTCLYQEQFMEIAKQIAGFSPAEADDLRKAIGKKNHKLMASLKDRFLEGCAASGTTPSVANQLWKDIEASQDYSFNKAHAACYALIAYRTAWMRAHHPREYMAALISSVMNTKDRV